MGWLSVLPVFSRSTSVFSMSDILEKSCSIAEMRLSKVIPDRVIFSSIYITGVSVSPTCLVVVSFIVPNVDTVLVSSSSINIFGVIYSFGRSDSAVIRDHRPSLKCHPMLYQFSLGGDQFSLPTCIIVLIVVFHLVDITE